MTPATDEKHLQQNAIDLLTRMGYTYISPEEMARYRDSNARVTRMIEHQGEMKCI